CHLSSLNSPVPVFLPDNIDDDTLEAIIEQRPDLEHILRAQRKVQIRRQQLPYVMKRINDEYENDEQQDINMVVENDDDDITRPLSDFDDGRTTEFVDPSLVVEPEERFHKEYIKKRSGRHKQERLNDTRREGIFGGGTYVFGMIRSHAEKAWDESWRMTNCYTCYFGFYSLPRHNLCHTAFHSNDWKYRTTKRYFRTVCYYHYRYRNERNYKGDRFWKYKKYKWHNKYEYGPSNGLTIHRLGIFAHGCMKRWSDVGEVFTMRACRGHWPMYIGGLMESRGIRMDFSAQRFEHNNTCRTSPHATLIPFHRGISLFGRYHSCACLGRYCNDSVVNNIYMPGENHPMTSLARAKREGVLNVHEIILALEDDHNILSADIFITPPDNDDLSDEDSGSEEAGDISNLSRRQLLAEAEVSCKTPSADGVLATVDGILCVNQDEQTEQPST
ncbi:hypothetical protein SFRURICE_008506, partial [Spodoptera frugiperda]